MTKSYFSMALPVASLLNTLMNLNGVRRTITYTFAPGQQRFVYAGVRRSCVHVFGFYLCVDSKFYSSALYLSSHTRTRSSRNHNNNKKFSEARCGCRICARSRACACVCMDPRQITRIAKLIVKKKNRNENNATMDFDLSLLFFPFICLFCDSPSHIFLSFSPFLSLSLRPPSVRRVYI